MPLAKFTISRSNRSDPSHGRQGAFSSKYAPSSAASFFSAPNKTLRAIHNFPNPDEEVNVRQDADNKN
jgi:hypothetical protein